jgi:hypothetical protein
LRGAAQYEGELEDVLCGLANPTLNFSLIEKWVNELLQCLS